jgi:hypothetical protein
MAAGRLIRYHWGLTSPVPPVRPLAFLGMGGAPR